MNLIEHDMNLHKQIEKYTLDKLKEYLDLGYMNIENYEKATTREQELTKIKLEEMRQWL